MMVIILIPSFTLYSSSVMCQSLCTALFMYDSILFSPQSYGISIIIVLILQKNNIGLDGSFS